MAKSPPLRPETIVVVEDEALIRLELEAQLKDLGYRVLVAADADEAIALLDGHPEVTLLFTDLTMPGSMDGARLAQHVRDRWPPIRIILTSGKAADAFAMPAGSLFLAKPYHPKSICAALSSCPEARPAG